MCNKRSILYLKLGHVHTYPTNFKNAKPNKILSCLLGVHTNLFITFCLLALLSLPSFANFARRVRISRSCQTSAQILTILQRKWFFKPLYGHFYIYHMHFMIVVTYKNTQVENFVWKKIEYVQNNKWICSKIWQHTCLFVGRKIHFPCAICWCPGTYLLYVRALRKIIDA